MAVEIVTREDLQALRVQLLNDIRALLVSHMVQPSKRNIEGFKIMDVNESNKHFISLIPRFFAFKG